MPTFNVSDDSGEYRFIVNSSENSQFNAVAENSDASESDISFTEKSAKPENIRSFFLASREISSDVQGFQNFVQQRGFQMLIDQQNGQILNGNGTSPNLSGLTLSANRTAFDYTASNTYYQSVDNANEIDCLIVSIKFFSCLKLFTAKLLQVFVISSSKSNLKVSLTSSSGIPRNETMGFFTFPLLEIINVISKSPFTEIFFLSLIDGESKLTATLPSK